MFRDFLAFLDSEQSSEFPELKLFQSYNSVTCDCAYVLYGFPRIVAVTIRAIRNRLELMDPKVTVNFNTIIL